MKANALSTLISIMISIVFFSDIVLNFRFSFINETGDEVTNPKLIAIHYLKRWFFIDFLAFFPLELIFKLHRNFRFLTIVKILKII